MVYNIINYKLALAKGICHLSPWKPNPVLRQLLIFDDEGSSWCRMRHSVLQGNWWNRALDRRFQQLISWCQSLHLHISRKVLNPFQFSSVQSLSNVWLFATPWMAAHQGLPDQHQLPESTQTHIHPVSDAIQPSHPPSSPSPPAPNPSQHQSLFKWVNSSHEVARVLEIQLQHHYFQINPSAALLQNGLIGSPCSPKDSQESSPTPQFKSINSSAFSPLHIPTLTSIHEH